MVEYFLFVEALKSDYKLFAMTFSMLRENLPGGHTVNGATNEQTPVMHLTAYVLDDHTLKIGARKMLINSACKRDW